MSDLDADARWWVGYVARAYSNRCTEALDERAMVELGRALQVPIKDLVFGGDFGDADTPGALNAVIAEWERGTGRRLGPRVIGLSWRNRTIEVSGP